MGCNARWGDVLDIATIDQQYQLLEQESAQLGQVIDVLASKMQTSGDDKAKEWLLDLKGITLQIQQEQLQVQSLLQALHGFVISTLQAPPPPAVAVQPLAQTAPTSPGYLQDSASSLAESPHGGMLSHFSGSNFGRSVTSGMGMGVGFGLADSLIGSIFGR